MAKVYLILDGGEIYEGEGFGAAVPAEGELVFMTGSVGYLEKLTDPASAGEIIVYTFPSLGNYGVIPAELNPGDSRAAGIVVREWCPTPSNFRAEGDIDAFLRERGIPGVAGVDTRDIMRIIRDKGAVRARITTIKPNGEDDTRGEI